MAGKYVRELRKRMPPPGQGAPVEAETPPPPAAMSAELAQDGEPLVRGNSDQEPLTPTGHAQISQVGQDLARAGGPTLLAPSTAERTMETAQDVQAQQPSLVPVAPQPGLESHALGQLEGEPKTPEVKRFLAKMIKQNPDARIPGQGAQSARGGESFNEYRQRALGAVRGLMQQLALDPTQRIVVPDHSQITKLIGAWGAAGHPDDLSVDAEHMVNAADARPGEMHKFAPSGPDGQWSLEKFNPRDASEFTPGALYFLNHGETPSHAGQQGQVSQAMRERGEIMKHVRALDWGRARATARRSGLSDQDIQDSIDAALPDAESAWRVAPQHLLAMASAAGPEKLQELRPALQAVFSPEALSALPPDHAQALQAHLAQILPSA